MPTSQVGPSVSGAGSAGHRPAGPKYRVDGAFRRFYEHFGASLCGEPLSDRVDVDGVPTQYFERLALEEYAPGRVRPKALGREALARHLEKVAQSAAQAPEVIDVTAALAAHPSRRYPRRPLSAVRYLVIHHTGASPAVGAAEVAAEHVEVNGWPGIGYHYVVDGGGAVTRTQDLAVESYHVRQFNRAAVGVALTGDFASDVPAPAQLDAAAALLAELLRDLGLPTDALRGHRELVPTDCPGETFATLWKPRLIRLVEARLPSPGAAPGGQSRGRVPSAQ